MKNAHRLNNFLRVASEEIAQDAFDKVFKPEIFKVIKVLVPLVLIEGYDEDTEEIVKGSMACFKDGSALLRFDDKILVLDLDDEEEAVMFKVVMELSKKYLKPHREMH